MQMSFDTGDSCVNKLIVGDFNQLSRAIQGDTQRFELIAELRRPEGPPSGAP